VVRDVQPIGPYKDVVRMPSPTDSDKLLRSETFVQMGVQVDTFRKLLEFGLATAIAQYYGNVQEGLAFADDVVHLFKGLERPLMHESNMQADRDMLMYSWVPRRDWEWDRSTQMPKARTPAPNRVFTVTVRPFPQEDEYRVAGIVLHWGWKDEDSMLRGAPVDPKERFSTKVWSKRK